MNPSPVQLLRMLAEARVACVLIGGMAANLHGSTVATFDCDVVIALNEENLVKAWAALEGVHPKFRHQEPPVWFDEESARAVRKIYYLETDLGVLDCVGEVKGVGDYLACLAGSVEVELDDRVIRVLDRDTLIKSKEALGRPKDLQTAAQLRVAGGIEPGEQEGEG